MKLLVAVAPERFRDEELSEPMKIFKAKGIETVIGSTKTGECMGMIGDRIEATVVFEDVAAADFDGIMIVGGIGSQDFFWNSQELIGLVKDFYENQKVVAAICLSPAVLALAGILKGKKATVFTSPASTYAMKEGGASLQNDPVVVDGKIITANGPTAAKAFGEAIVTVLNT